MTPPTTADGTTFSEALASHAAARPDDPAVTCGEGTLTWAGLHEASERLAHAYATRGVGAGSYVSIALPNSPAFLAAAFAAWRLGAMPQPISARTPAAELRAILDVVRPAGVVGLDPATATQVAGASLPAEAPAVVDTVTDLRVLPRVVSPAWKAPTSGGSTGRPKVIVAGAPALVEQVDGFAALLRIPAGGTAAVPGPLHHNAPFMFTVLALLRGTHVVLQGGSTPRPCSPRSSDTGSGWCYAVPTMMQRIRRLPDDVRDGYDLSSLDLVVHMAAPCPPWLKREWIAWQGGARLLEVYAGTEAQAATAIDGDDWLAHEGSVGRPVLGEITVLGPDGEPLPPGEVGEVWMRRGADAPPAYHYLGAEARRRDGGWECLGDLGRLDADGYLYLSDRDTDVVLVGGSNVYPAEVEAALVEHPAILDACVVGLPHHDLGAVPHAIVQASGPVDLDEVTAFLREWLSSYKLPRSLEVVDHRLRDDAGKVRRSALRAERLVSEEAG